MEMWQQPSYTKESRKHDLILRLFQISIILPDILCGSLKLRITEYGPGNENLPTPNVGDSLSSQSTNIFSCLSKSVYGLTAIKSFVKTKYPLTPRYDFLHSTAFTS